jgi:hypothetical protein
MTFTKRRRSDWSNRWSSSILVKVTTPDGLITILRKSFIIILGPLSRGLRNSRKAGRNMTRISAGAPMATSRIAEVRFGIIIV